MTKYDDTDLARLPLDRVRAIADRGDGAITRAAAKAELERRTAAADAQPQPPLRLQVSASRYGTPRPEIVVEIAPRSHPDRHLSARLHEVAAQVERALADTREGWPVALREIDEYVGAVYLELMDGLPREVDRATAALRTVVGDGGGDVPPQPRRKRDLRAERERRKARAAGSAEPAPTPEAPLLHTTAPAPEAANDAAPAAPTTEVTVTIVGGGAPRRTGEREARRAYTQLAGASAVEFEQRCLGYGREHLPAHAVAVLDGRSRTAEYWTWLREEYASTLPAKAE